MATTFYPGQTLGRTDLNLFLMDSNSNPINAFEISYAIYWVDPGPPEVEVLIGSPTRDPVNPQVGEYWAALMVPPSAVEGTYRIRWTFKQYASSPNQTVVQEWSVAASEEATVVTYDRASWEMMQNLRMLIRDHDPDRHYHFRPPEHEGRIGHYDRVFGQIWEDQELKQYLDRALEWWNTFPPMTPSLSSLTLLIQGVPYWGTSIYWGAIVHALFAVSLNWIADEFDYSIGGVSLSIEKSSKYQGLMSDAQAQFDKAVEAKARTVKFFRGLQQPRFGIGIRSSFGPNVGKGVLTPRSFLVWTLLPLGGKLISEVLPYVNSLSALWS